MKSYNKDMPNEPEIIEAEVVPNESTQETTRRQTPSYVLRANQPPAWNTPGDHARPYGDHGGMLGGFLTLAVGFLVTLFILLVSVCIILPCMLILRVLGVRKSN